eukprot:14237042-Ditylum_brightwellii.AAC.2
MDLLLKKDKKEDGLTVTFNATFPFPDMEMLWDGEIREMRFRVFQKPNQALKYVDKASTHQTTTFKSDANGVFTRLARLTSNTTTNKNLQIKKLYLDHAEALMIADLTPLTVFPVFKQLWKGDSQWRN